MLIEQIIELELRGLGPLAVHAIVKLVIFMTRQKSPTQSSSELLFIAKNIAGDNVASFL